MNEKERLESINEDIENNTKKEYEFITTLLYEDVKWLFEQAEEKIKMQERMEELEKKCKALKITAQQLKDTIAKTIGWYEIAYNRNQCYKKALEEILEGAYEEAGIHPDTGMQLETFIVKKARQALQMEAE